MFSRRWLLNGILLLAIILIVWLGGLFDTPREAQPVRGVAGFDAASIERIEIRNPAFSLLFLRRDQRWSIVEPLQWPASQDAVGRLLDIPMIGDLQPLERDGLDPAALGFNASATELHLGGLRIRFGIANNIGDRRYTMIAEDIYLLPDLHAPFIGQGLPGFVDRRLLPPDFELARLELPGATLRRGEQGWESPELPAQQAADLADGWQQQEASRVVAYGEPAGDAIRIVASLADASEIEFLLSPGQAETVIANPALGLRYHFPAALRGRLLPPQDD